MKFLISVLSLLVFVSSTAFAEQKVVKHQVVNKKKEAIAYYFKLLPVSLSRQIALDSLPADARQEASRYLTTQFFENVVAKELDKHFTAEEIIAIADFYGGPIGKKVVIKYPAYLQDVTEEFKRGMSKFSKENTKHPSQKSQASGGMSMVP